MGNRYPIRERDKRGNEWVRFRAVFVVHEAHQSTVRRQGHGVIAVVTNQGRGSSNEQQANQRQAEEIARALDAQYGSALDRDAAIDHARRTAIEKVRRLVHVHWSATPQFCDVEAHEALGNLEAAIVREFNLSSPPVGDGPDDVAHGAPGREPSGALPEVGSAVSGRREGDTYHAQHGSANRDGAGLREAVTKMADTWEAEAAPIVDHWARSGLRSRGRARAQRRCAKEIRAALAQSPAPGAAPSPRCPGCGHPTDEHDDTAGCKWGCAWGVCKDGNALVRGAAGPPPAAQERGPFAVLFKMDADPLTVSLFADESRARAYYDTLAVNWSEVYLCRLLAGPREVMDGSARGIIAAHPPAPTAEPLPEAGAGTGEDK